MSSGTKGPSGTEMVCPKCGLRQPLALDCVGCGVIIDRYRPAARPQQPQAPATPKTPAAPAPTSGPPAAGAGQPPRAVAPAAPRRTRRPSPAAAAPEEIYRVVPRPEKPSPAVPGDLYQGEPMPEDSPPPEDAAGDLYDGTNPFADDGTHTRDLGTRSTGLRSTDYQLQELSSLSILGEAFGILGRHFFSFMIIVGVVLFPAILFTGYATSELTVLQGIKDIDPESAEIQAEIQAEIKRALTLFGVGTLIQFLCMPLAIAAVTFGVGQELREKKTTMFDCVQAALTVLIPVVGVTIIQTVLIGLVAAVAIGLGAVGVIFLMTIGWALGCIAGLGLVAIALLVTAFAAAFAVTIPATVEERPGIFGALRRSWELTEGARWMIVWYYIFLGIVGFVIWMVLVVLGASVSQGAGQLAAQVAQVVVTAINAAGAAVIYFRLRSIDERTPVAQLSSASAGGT